MSSVPDGAQAMRRIRSSSPTTRFRGPHEDSATARPKAVLTTLTLLGVIYTASISGGYGLEDSVSAGGPLLTIGLLLLIPFLWGIPVSMCVAELSCAIPSNAGPIMWVNCSFHPWVTFMTVLWTAFLNAVDNSLYPAVFADYCATFFSLTLIQKALLKVVFLWFCAFVNMVGMHLVGRFSVAIMLVTMLPFFLIFLLQVPHGLDWDRITYIPNNINWALFMPVVAWNFSGFDSAGNVVEEVQNIHPTFVRALILMIVAALFTYIPPILAGASAEKLRDVPFDHWGDGFWIKVGSAVGGLPMEIIVMIGGGISTLGLMTTLLATTSRSLAGMGTLNAFPAFFSQWISTYSEKYNTPVNAIIVNTVVTCVLAVSLHFHVLVGIDQVLYSLRLITVLASFLKLRWYQPNLERPFSAPGGTVAAFFWAGVPMAFCLTLIVVSMSGEPIVTYSSAVLIVGTIIVSYIAVRFYRQGGFEGSLVEEYEDADMGTYGSILVMESSEWRKFHTSNTFIDESSHFDYSIFDRTRSNVVDNDESQTR